MCRPSARPERAEAVERRARHLRAHRRAQRAREDLHDAVDLGFIGERLAIRRPGGRPLIARVGGKGDEPIEARSRLRRARSTRPARRRPPQSTPPPRSRRGQIGRGTTTGVTDAIVASLSNSRVVRSSAARSAVCAKRSRGFLASSRRSSRRRANGTGGVAWAGSGGSSAMIADSVCTDVSRWKGCVAVAIS